MTARRITVEAVRERLNYWRSRIPTATNERERTARITNAERLEKQLAKMLKAAGLPVTAKEGADKACGEIPHEQSPVVAPHEFWLLVAQRRFQSGNMVIDRGCTVEPAALGANFQSLLDRRFVAWQPPGTANPAVKPRELPPSKPPLPKPQAILVEHPDKVQSWKLSLAATAKQCGDDWGKARDLLQGSEPGCKLYLEAVKIDSANNARKAGTVGRRIVSL